MSLYSLDILIDKEGRKHLIEIGGVTSGMRGFEKIYGDDRVQREVYGMLQDEYGKITWDNGTYANQRYKAKHPFKFLLSSILWKIPKMNDIIPSLLRSEKALVEWLDETPENTTYLNFPFEVYTGQLSTVINQFNQVLVEEQVNHYVTEEITRNKFLQYRVLKDSDVNFLLPNTALVGLGFAVEKELEELVQFSEEFIIKPIRGNCGKGVKKLIKEDVLEFLSLKGPVRDLTPMDSLGIIFGRRLNIQYLEDIMVSENYTFENGLAIIQPFIDSRIFIGDKESYSAVRAIVCNGTFVDAYLKFSQSKTVNVSQDAQVLPFEETGFDKFCEKIISVFENECYKFYLEENNSSVIGEKGFIYHPFKFKQTLYTKYLDDVGRTPPEEKLDEKTRIMIAYLFSVAGIK